MAVSSKRGSRAQGRFHSWTVCMTQKLLSTYEGLIFTKINSEINHHALHGPHGLTRKQRKALWTSAPMVCPASFQTRVQTMGFGDGKASETTPTDSEAPVPHHPVSMRCYCSDGGLPTVLKKNFPFSVDREDVTIFRIEHWRKKPNNKHVSSLSPEGITAI